MSNNPNSNYKDSVFTALFSEPAQMLELYNAISGSNYPADTPIEINTLTDVLFQDRLNYISFVLDDTIVVLTEHQSTINENMPLRFLMYIARVYKKMIDNTAVYRRKRMKLPTPVFWVLYNGKAPFPQEDTLRLSDSYKEILNASGFGSLELGVRIININKGYNEEITRRSETLYSYVTFIAKVREYLAEGFELQDAITRAVKYCIDNEILAAFLRNNSSEVLNMLTTAFDLDTALAVSREEGWEEGAADGIRDTITEMLKNGASTELAWTVAQNLGLTVSGFEKIKKSLNIK